VVVDLSLLNQVCGKYVHTATVCTYFPQTWIWY